MVKRSHTPSPAASGCELGAAAAKRLKSMAQRHPKVTASLEAAREVGVLAAEATRQLAVGIKQGADEIAARHARAPAPAQPVRRRAAAPRKRA